MTATEAAPDAPTSDAPDLSRLSLNTATTHRWTLREAAEGAARAGLDSIGLWRDRVHEAGLDESARIIAGLGLRVSSLCRGGFLTAEDPVGTAAALADNRAAIVEAATLGTRELLLVVGGLPAASGPGPGAQHPAPAGDGDGEERPAPAGDGEERPAPAGDGVESRCDIAGARQRVADRISELVPFAEQHDVRLVIEPLHPMFAADRAVISTLGQALDVAASFPARSVGVAVDTYHVWWDPDLERQIARAGAEGRLAAYQVCDWMLPLADDVLLSRGHVGDGFIDFASISRWVAAAGYTGDVEVEIFRQEIWDAPGAQTLATLSERYVRHVLPHLQNAPVGRQSARGALS